MENWFSASLFLTSADVTNLQVHEGAVPIRELLDRYAPAGYTSVRTIEHGTKLPQAELHAARLDISPDHLVKLVGYLRAAHGPLRPSHEVSVVAVRATHEEVKAVAFSRAPAQPLPIRLDTHIGPRVNPRHKCSSWSTVRRPIEKARRQGCVETLLIDEERRIYEGTVSNVFFLRNDGVLVTAPDDVVLPGTLRAAIIEGCRRCNIPVLFECVALDEISRYTAAFITNTSRILHPVEAILNGEDEFLLPGDTPFIDHLRDEVNKVLKLRAMPL